MPELFVVMYLTIPIVLFLLVFGAISGSLNKPVPRWAWIFLGGLVLVIIVAVLL